MDLTTDPRNCGECGYRCIWGECRAGQCSEGAGNPAGALGLGDPCGSDQECASDMLGGPGAIQSFLCRDTMTGGDQPRCCSVGGCEFDGDCCGAMVCRYLYEGALCVEKDTWSRSLGQRCDDDDQCRISPTHMDPVCGMLGRRAACCIGAGSPCSGAEDDFCCDGLECRDAGCAPFEPVSPLMVLRAIRPSLGNGDLPLPVARKFDEATSGYADVVEARRLFASLGWSANAAIFGKADPETELFVSVHGFGSKPEAAFALDFINRDLLFGEDADFDYTPSDCEPCEPTWKCRNLSWLVGRPVGSATMTAFIVLMTAGPYVILVRTVMPTPAGECAGFDLAEAVAAAASKTIRA